MCLNYRKVLYNINRGYLKYRCKMNPKLPLIYQGKGSKMKNNSKDIMVCVTQQKSCERLIKRGAEIRDTIKGELHVIHVVKEGWKYFGKLKESDALEFLFDRAKAYGADLTVVKAPDIEETLSTFVEKNNIKVIVMGESKEKSEQQNMIRRLKKKLVNEVVIDVVPLTEAGEKAV